MNGDDEPGETFPITGDGSQGEPGQTKSLPQVEGYRIVGMLGQGGMGTVWRAVQLSTHREVALKLLGTTTFGSETARARFEREVELAARLEHPNIARVYDSGLHKGAYFYAMALIDGVSLDEYVQGHTLDRRQVLALMRTVCQAVDHAHQRGIVHRDLKPSNILVTEDGQPHVLDFGLARPLLEEDKGQTVSIDGEITGTPAYMSPEQATGRREDVDAGSDVYALGVILYRLLTGQSPVDLSGTRLEVLQRIAAGQIRPPSESGGSLGAELAALLQTALAHDRDSRYACAGELADDISNYLTGDPLRAMAPTATYVLRKRIRKHRLAIAVAVFVFALVAATGAIVHLYSRRRDGGDHAKPTHTAVRPARLRQTDRPTVPLPPIRASDVYVSAARGSDITGDGSQERPLRTIQHALSRTKGTKECHVQIHVAAGEYEGPVVLDKNDGYTHLLGGYNAAKWSDRRYETAEERAQSTYRTVIVGKDVTKAKPPACYGGCVRCLHAGRIEISGFTITSGQAVWGGGIYTLNTASSLRHNTIAGNHAQDGGGVWSAGSAVSVSNGAIVKNRADRYGGGIHVQGGGASVETNSIQLNTARYGGGMCIGQSVPPRLTVIRGNRIIENKGGYEGVGGIAACANNTDIVNNLICGNTGHHAGGIKANTYKYGYTIQIIGNTIVENRGELVGGIWISGKEGGLVRIHNCLFGRNTGRTAATILGYRFPMPAEVKNVTVDANFNVLVGGRQALRLAKEFPLIWGKGNLDADPLFVRPGQWEGDKWIEGDYHLKSTAGRWTDQGWIKDNVNSPCIDAGDPASPFDQEPKPNGGRINMGAYGNTAQASKGGKGPTTTRPSSRPVRKQQNGTP